MINGFTTKKIKSQIALSEKLKSTRIRKKISILDAEIGTKVRSKYLIALENGNWKELPQNVYTRGFVLAYAKFLGLETKPIMELYKKELEYIKKEDQKISYNQSVKESKVLITPKFLAYSTLSIFIISMFGYIVFQLMGFAGTPTLKISNPENNIVLETEAVDLAGVTDTDTFVTVNNENVPVTGEGKFSMKLKLHKGVNVIKVKAVNKAKKESSQVYTIEYKPKTASIENNLNQ